MSDFRSLICFGAIAVTILASSALAQQRTSPVRPPSGDQIPVGSYQQSCRGANMNGNMLSAQCTGPTGAPVFSSINTNGCRGRDIANDQGYLRCGNTPGPRPPVPPGNGGGNRGFEAIAYTSAGFRGQAMTIREPIANLGNFRGFNDNIRSIRIVRGRAEVCEDSRYRGRCVTLNRSYLDLNTVGMGNRISSIR